MPETALLVTPIGSPRCECVQPKPRLTVSHFCLGCGGGINWNDLTSYQQAVVSKNREKQQPTSDGRKPVWQTTFASRSTYA